MGEQLLNLCGFPAKVNKFLGSEHVPYTAFAAFIDTRRPGDPPNGGLDRGMFFATLFSKRAVVLSATKMQVRVDVDEHIDSSEELSARVEGVVEGTLERYAGRVARVDVHLSRLVTHKRGERDMVCRMEAFASSVLKPISVVHQGMTMTEAIHAASAKLERAVHAALASARKVDIKGEVPRFAR
jgi:ribosome-associated translation inhibitor RaiA